MPRFLRFRLRSIFILTTVIAVGLAWWSSRVDRQRRAVDVLEKNGATVIYECDLNESGRIRAYWRGSHRPWYTDFQYNVREVWLHRTATTEEIAALQAIGVIEVVLLANEFPSDIDRVKAALPGCDVVETSIER